MKIRYEPMKDICFVLGLNKRKLKHVKFIKQEYPIFLSEMGVARQLTNMKFSSAKDIEDYIINSGFTVLYYMDHEKFNLFRSYIQPGGTKTNVIILRCCGE